MSIKIDQNITYWELTKLLLDEIAITKNDIIVVSWGNRSCAFSMGMIQQLQDIDILVSFIWEELKTEGEISGPGLDD